jgi:protein phosphatase
LGVEPAVEVDLLRVGPQHGDRFLLCSDGLPREATDDQIAAVLSRFDDPAETAKELVSLANSRGGSDNVTVVVVDVKANDPTGETLFVVPGPASSQGQPGVWQDSPSTYSGAAAGGYPDDDNTYMGHNPYLDDGGPLTSAVPAAGPVDTGAAPKGRRPRPRVTGPPQPRRVTLRVASFFLVCCLVLGGAIAGLAWYARSTYYVTIAKGHITIFQGRPGGVLWFGPTVAQATAYTSSSVLAFEVPLLRAGQLEPTLADARTYIARLVQRKKATETAGRPPVASTTTTVPPPHHPTRAPHKVTTTAK